MQSLLEWLKHPWHGAPAWVWLVAFVGLPLVNELIQRAKWTKAQSILQAGVRMLLVPFGKVPVLGDVLRALAAEPAPALPPVTPIESARKEEPTMRPTGDEPPGAA